MSSAPSTPPAQTPRAVRSPSNLRVASPGPRATSSAATRLTAPSPSAHPSRPATPVTTTVNGQAVDTRYGPVQVQIQIRSGRITRADAIDYPQSDGRSQEINSQAVPQLDQETLSAQSSRIDTVSGATYTSDGYRQSLQSALDAAHKAGAM